MASKQSTPTRLTSAKAYEDMHYRHRLLTDPKSNFTRVTTAKMQGNQFNCPSMYAHAHTDTHKAE